MKANGKKTSAMIAPITLIILLSAIAFIQIAGSASAVTLDDPQNDVKGGPYVSGVQESINVTCGNLSTLPFIDIKSISWNEDTTDYNVTIEMWGAIDTAKILSDEVQVKIEFDVNGSTIELSQFFVTLGLSPMPPITWNGSLWWNNGSSAVNNCVKNASTSLTWIFGKSSISSIPGILPMAQWSIRAYTIYHVEGQMFAWDVYNYTTFETDWGIVCVTAGPGISSFPVPIILVAIAVPVVLVAMKTTRKAKHV
nr:hypothetical protein [Candidatus Sigynarchaeota archaeon]